MSDRTLTIDTAGARRRARVRSPRPGLLVLYTEGRLPGAATVAGQAETTVGRGADQDLFVEDSGLSRRHALVRFRPDGSLGLCDQGSHNGTFLGGARLEAGREVPLGYDQIVRCGATLLMAVADVAAYAGWPEPPAAGPMIGGPAMVELQRSIALLADERVEVLIAGESGTGKELAASLLHTRSGRGGRFVPVNCAAVPAELFEAELFGVLRGAFTGAVDSRPGLIREASGGTLFLDEIGELPLKLQPKLLRALEQREVRPVGGDRPLPADHRLVAATNRDLAGEVTAGAFREDLFHRLCGVTLTLPPLRERRADVVLLARHFLAGDGAAPPMSADFVAALLAYHWPGNVRELQRTLDEACHHRRVARDAALEREHLRPNVRGAGAGAEVDPERARLIQALREAGGNVGVAADALGVSRSKLYHQLRALGIRPAEHRGG